MFLHFKKLVERQFQAKIQCLQTDWGGGYKKLQPILLDLGIIFFHSCPHTHQQNGKAERKHRSIVDTGLTLLAEASMDLRFWWDAFLSTVYHCCSQGRVSF